MNLPSATTIGTKVFQNCTSLSSVTFPSVTTIGDYAFDVCSALSSVTFPLTTTIGTGAFFNCSKLLEVSFPSATSVVMLAFGNCISMQRISLPNATTIGNSAFIMNDIMTGLTYLNLSSCTSMGTNVFNNISGCTLDLYIPLAMTGETSVTNLLANNHVTLNP